jgi:hypothetical protein
VLAQYEDFCDRQAQKERSDYERFKALEDFLTGGRASSEGASSVVSREAGRAPTKEEKQLEEHKQQRLVGKGGIQEALADSFRDMLADYMPGGYFKYNDWAKKLSDEFYRRAYAMFKEILPRLIADKVREAGVKGIDAQSIKADPESIYEVTSEAMVWLQENPEKLKEGLTRAFKRSIDKGNRMGFAQAFFRPTVSDEKYKELLEEAGKKGETLRKRPVDRQVLDMLEEGDEIKWKMVKKDEGRVTFTLPRLFGDREFTIAVPPQILSKSLRPGEYTFKVVDKKKSGAVLEFTDQMKAIEEKGILGSIEAVGLGPDQLESFIYNGIVSSYKNFLRSQPTEKLLEDYIGQVSIEGVNINDFSDLKDFQEKYKEEEGERPKGRGGAITEKQQEAREYQRKKIERITETWTPVLKRYFLTLEENKANKIADAVARKFPENFSGKVTFQSVLTTAPVIRMILDIIMDPTTPMAAGGKAEPWRAITKDKFLDLIDTDPAVKRHAAMLVAKKNPEKYKYVSDEDIRSYFDSLRDTDWTSALRFVVPKIRETMLSMKDHPVLREFFQRRKAFRGYIEKDLVDYVETVIEEQKLDLTDTKDLNKVHQAINDMVNRTLKRMKKTADDDLVRDIIRLAMKKGTFLS